VDSGLREEEQPVAEVVRTLPKDHATEQPLEELEASGIPSPAQKAP